MAGSKQKPRRRRKRRGTQAGTVKQARRPRASRAAAPKQTAQQRRQARADSPPSWRTAILRAAATAAFLFVMFALILKRDVGGAIKFAGLAFLFYVPAFFFFDSFMYQRRQRQKQRARERDDE